MATPAFLPPHGAALRPPPHHRCLTSSQPPPSRRPLVSALPVQAPPITAPNIITVDPFSAPLPARHKRPTRPILIIPGYGADCSDYEPMAAALRTNLPGAHITIAPIRARTWLATIGGRPVTPVLSLLDTAVRTALAATGADSVSLVAHSAAGWISRIYLGDAAYPPTPAPGARAWRGARFVHTLVCLGTPHRSAEPVTRRNMDFVNREYPGSYYPDVRYVNFAGDGGSVGNGGGAANWMFWRGDWVSRLSYRLTDRHVHGKAVEGDGIVPLSVAFLDDADKNIRLKGVWHSPASKGPWYGDPPVVEYWSTFLK